MAGQQRQWERAVRLLGAAEGVARAMDGARAALGEAAFAAACAEGQVMPLEQAIAYALEAAGEV
jgi:hypothetical protein